jgi:SpoVK/Ycf46/Vps4 family AAA+-type ATPase
MARARSNEDVMGEKLLAQRALSVLRDTVGQSSREAVAALEWARGEREWLWPGRDWGGDGAEGETIDWDSLRALASEIDAAEQPPEMFDSIRSVADLLDLDGFDRRLIEATAGFQRLPRLGQLSTRLTRCGADMIALLGAIAGAASGSALARVRRSDALGLGLLSIEREYLGAAELRLHWRFAQLLDEGWVDEEKLVAALVGVRQESALVREDFREHEADFDLLVRLLSGALKTRAAGVNILIHGPPGTGKTEFARTLAEEVGARLFAVGEADCDGDEPSRRERLDALRRAQRLLARRGDSLLLFDELEDLFAEASATATGEKRSGSKIFVNRLLEQIAVPVIWTSNSLDIDSAHLRRMSFVLRMNYPSARARERIAARAAEAEGVTSAADGLGTLLRNEPESASIARVALRTAALAGGRAEDAAAAGHALLRGLRGGRSLAPGVGVDALDLSLYDGGESIEQLVDRLTADEAPLDFSLLLSGPPGTGKTALAAHVARELDRPLAVKRASDLLSKWVGGTEANIADAFADARETGAVLLFDEADSLLTDRGNARASWEVTQVNELLTWMDQHPLPFIAATNFVRRLDRAVFRRFLFKIELKPLGRDAVERAFVRFFGVEPPRTLREVQGLTPGDFAVVRRQLRYQPSCSPAQLVELLAREAEAKPGTSWRIGF